MMTRLGIGDGTRVVAYDERGGIYAARLWWILNYFGHSNVALMNGSWNKWSADIGLRCTDAAPQRTVTFTPKPQPRWLATASDVVSAINKSGTNGW